VAGFLKALIMPVANLPLAAGSYFAFTFKFFFSAVGFGSENENGREGLYNFFSRWGCFNRASRK
jgi:hypothetical protein